MTTRICFAYPWATFGGCERVFINRAMAFKKYLPDVKVDFFFISDGGGLRSFHAAIEKYKLESIASVTSSIDGTYDLISIVDCPELLPTLKSSHQKYIIECHTGYPENRKYLSNLPRECKIIAAPSTRFCNLIRDEFPNLSASVLELANFVPWDIEDYQPRDNVTLPEWTRKPILFFGRMDKLKNVTELLDAFKIIEDRRPGEFMLLLCGPRSIEVNIERAIMKRGLSSIVAMIPPIPFHAASTLMEAVRKAKGIFVSPSQGESFGLSAAEAISARLPPVLSDLDAHLDLVDGANEIFTYPLGNINHLANRIEYILDNHSVVDNALCKLRVNFSAENFISHWKNLLNTI